MEGELDVKALFAPQNVLVSPEEVKEEIQEIRAAAADYLNLAASISEDPSVEYLEDDLTDTLNNFAAFILAARDADDEEPDMSFMIDSAGLVPQSELSFLELIFLKNLKDAYEALILDGTRLEFEPETIFDVAGELSPDRRSLLRNFEDVPEPLHSALIEICQNAKDFDDPLDKAGYLFISLCACASMAVCQLDLDNPDEDPSQEHYYDFLGLIGTAFLSASSVLLDAGLPALSYTDVWYETEEGGAENAAVSALMDGMAAVQDEADLSYLFDLFLSLMQSNLDNYKESDEE